VVRNRGSVFKYALVIQLALYAVSPFVTTDADDEGVGGDDDELQEEDPLFIPFPLTTRQVLGRPYRREDPEWQTYVKIQQNEQFQRLLKSRHLH
jgi:hypothetical protein